MTETTSSNSRIALWWMIPAVAIAYFFGELISGALITAAKLPWPVFPGSDEQSTSLLMNWTGSRRSLFWSLSISFFAMMGLVGLLMTFFFPPVLRVVHSIEILADAVVYAWVLVSLFIPKPRRAAAEQTEPVTVE